jgi:hypothetical protein
MSAVAGHAEKIFVLVPEEIRATGKAEAMLHTFDRGPRKLATS